MMHFSCDGCGKDLGDGSESHFVVRIEIYPAHDPSGLTDAEMDSDPLDELDELLQELDEGQLENPTPAATQVRYDLCDACRTRFSRDPLNRDRSRPKLKFSQN